MDTRQKMDTQEEMDLRFLHLIKTADDVIYETVSVTLQALIEGQAPRTALEMGNAVLIAAGREPVSVDDIMAKNGGKPIWAD